MKLTATAVKNAKPGRHTDGEGMYLLVTEAGQKYWRFDYRFLGKYKTLALGVFPDTTLAMARSKRAEANTASKRSRPISCKTQGKGHCQAET